MSYLARGQMFVGFVSFPEDHRVASKQAYRKRVLFLANDADMKPAEGLSGGVPHTPFELSGSVLHTPFVGHVGP